MKIGLTYDLKEDYLKRGYSSEFLAELDKPETIEGIENALISLGYETERVGSLDDLIEAIANNKRWDLVFNIAEGLFGYGRESAIPCVLDAYQIPYTFSDPAVLSTCLHKGITKRIVHHAKIPTADFHIISHIKELSKVKLPYPLFIKPVAEGTGKGIDEKSKVNNSNELLAQATELLDKYKQQLLIETYLPGREFTVGIIGTGHNAKVLGIMEILFNEKAYGNIYSYLNKAEYENKVEYQILKDKKLAKKIERICLKAWQTLNCRDAGRIDVRLDDKDYPNFIEVNPLAGLHPVDSDLVIMCRLLNIPFSSLIEMIIGAAKNRIQST